MGGGLSSGDKSVIPGPSARLCPLGCLILPLPLAVTSPAQWGTYSTESEPEVSHYDISHNRPGHHCTKIQIELKVLGVLSHLPGPVLRICYSSLVDSSPLLPSH